MAKRKYTRRRSKPAKKRRTYRRKKRVQQIHRGPLPVKLFAKLRFFESYSITGAVGVAARVFRPFSLFDPDFTGVGHQPRGFDQIMLMYREYRVMKCYMTCVFHAPSGTLDRTLVGIAARRDNTVSVDPRDYVENGGKWSILQNNGDKITMRIAINIPKFLGIDKPYSDNTLAGTASTNPADGVYFHVWTRSATGGTAANINFSAKLTFMSVFTEPIPLPIS